MASRALRVGVSLALMVALVGLFLWNVDLTEVARALAGARPDLLLAATCLALAGYWVRALRWQLILRPVGAVRHSSAVLTTAIGYAAGTLLPMRLGDLIRPLLLARRDRLPASATIASILTERVFDLWTVVAYFLVFLAWPPTMPDLDDTALRYLHTLSLSGYAVGAGLALGTVALLGLFRYQERFVAAVASPLARILPRWERPAASLLNHFLDGLRILQRPRDLVVTVLMSAALWLVIYLQVYATLLAFDLVLPFRATYLLVTLSVIGLAIPTPGSVGGFHKAIQVGLAVFLSVELNRATGIAIAYHAVCFLPITVVGLLCLPAVDLSLREVSAMAAQRDETGESR